MAGGASAAGVPSLQARLAAALLAERLFAAHRPHEALAAWERALALAPTDAALMSGKARALHAIGALDEAAALFAAARAADPAAAEAPFGLARMAMEAGRLDEAEALVAPLLAMDPGRPDFLWLAGRIARDRGDWRRAEGLLEQILDRPGLDPAQRAESLLELGAVMGELGRPAEAFAAAVEGKAMQRRLFADSAAGREGETAKLERLAAWFARADPDAWTAAPRRAPRAGPEIHAFLLGFPRSGTTLIEQALAGHPDVRALEEAPTFAAHSAAFLASDHGCERLARLGAEEADLWRGRYWETVAAHRGDAGGRVFLDKAPAGTLYLPLIARLFPEAKILFALRDPRDVVLSCLRGAFRMNALTYAFTSLADTADCYGAAMALAEVCRRVLSIEVLEVRHETLVADFPGGLARIAGFLGLEVHSAMADVAATAARRAVRTPSAAMVRAGLTAAGVGRWRAFADELAPVAQRLAPWIEAFGYPPAFRP